MKKAILFPLLLSSFALVSCGGDSSKTESSSDASTSSSMESSVSSSKMPSASSSIDTEELNKLKDLLSKQDLSPIYDKVFVSRFTQNYESYSSNNGAEEDIESRFYAYRGAGWFGCFYEVDEEAYAEAEALENPDFFDYLSRGAGDYGMAQTGDLVSYQYEKDEEETTVSLQGMQFAQYLDARFTETDVQVYNTLYVEDSIDGAFDGDAWQNFNGIIDKATLFATITNRAFSDIFARTNLFDGQRSCETLDHIYFATVKELCAKSDAELNDFIAKNDISIEEDGENTLVHFKVGDESLREALDENDIFPGDFEGTLSYEKESGKFTAFDYSIVYLSSESDADNCNVHTVSMEFKASGYSLNEKYGGEAYINPNPTVYEDAEAFLDDVVEEVIPPVF